MEPKRILAIICNGNADALAFCTALFNYVHLLDDFHDLDKPLTAETIALTSARFIEQLSFNTFYLEHKTSLFPLVVQSWNAWIDSTDMEASVSKIQRRDSDILKSFYHEIFYHVAYLIGGWEHQRAVTKTLREYDHDHLTKSEIEE